MFRTYLSLVSARTLVLEGPGSLTGYPTKCIHPNMKGLADLLDGWHHTHTIVHKGRSIPMRQDRTLIWTPLHPPGGRLECVVHETSEGEVTSRSKPFDTKNVEADIDALGKARKGPATFKAALWVTAVAGAPES